MNQIKEYNETTFESIKHINEYGNEYWYARELMQALEYSRWGNFLNVIEKAKLACKLSENRIEDHFADVSKMVRLTLVQMPKENKMTTNYQDMRVI